MFRLRTSSAGLLEDKKRCKMIIDERCVMCESGAEEDVEHLLMTCGEFETDRWVLLDAVSRIVGLESGWGNMEEGARRVR